MEVALVASLVANGVFAGYVLAQELARHRDCGGEGPVETIPGGGVAQDPDSDWEYDQTVIGFKPTHGIKHRKV